MDKLKEQLYTVEIYENQDGQTMVYLCADNVSGCEYPVNTADEIGEVLADYIKTITDKED